MIAPSTHPPRRIHRLPGRVLGLLAVIVFAVLLTGCSSSSQAGATSSATTTHHTAATKAKAKQKAAAKKQHDRQKARARARARAAKARKHRQAKRRSSRTTKVVVHRRAGPAWTIREARKALPKLRVAGPGNMSGYSREAFGPAWADVNHNGCDTRNDILNRDLVHKTWWDSSHCEVKTGVLHDPYTGKTIHFVQGEETSLAVQIDHMVALGDAWQTGARDWTAARREAFANDPRELLAVDGPTNEAKGDDDASDWLPARQAYDCQYAVDQIMIKRTYRLWTTPAEHQALAEALGNCR